MPNKITNIIQYETTLQQNGTRANIKTDSMTNTKLQPPSLSQAKGLTRKCQKCNNIPSRITDITYDKKHTRTFQRAITILFSSKHDLTTLHSHHDSYYLSSLYLLLLSDNLTVLVNSSYSIPLQIYLQNCTTNTVHSRDKDRAVTNRAVGHRARQWESTRLHVHITVVFMCKVRISSPLTAMPKYITSLLALMTGTSIISAISYYCNLFFFQQINHWQALPDHHCSVFIHSPLTIVFYRLFLVQNQSTLIAF